MYLLEVGGGLVVVNGVNEWMGMDNGWRRWAGTSLALDVLLQPGGIQVMYLEVPEVAMFDDRPPGVMVGRQA